MRLEFHNDRLMLVLSRRNLMSLLAKLDGHPPGSACTIIGGADAGGMMVKAEEDDIHYPDRPAGRMTDDTEAKITRPRTGTRWGDG